MVIFLIYFFFPLKWGLLTWLGALLDQPGGRASLEEKKGEKFGRHFTLLSPFSPGLFWRGDNAITRIASAPAPPPFPIHPITMVKPTKPLNSDGASKSMSADTEGTTRGEAAGQEGSGVSLLASNRAAGIEKLAFP